MNQTEKIVIDASGKSYSDIMIEVGESWNQNSTDCKITIQTSMNNFACLLWKCLESYNKRGVELAPKTRWERLKWKLFKIPTIITLGYSKHEQRKMFVQWRDKRVLPISGVEIPVQINE